MSRVLLVSTSSELEQQVRVATDGDVVSLPVWPIPPEPADVLVRMPPGILPDVVVLDPGVAIEQALVLAARLDERYPGMSVVLVSDSGPQIAVEAMRAGIRDIIHPATDSYEIRLVLDRAAQAAVTWHAVRTVDDLTPPPPPPPLRRGKVISVASPKGGVGKTTVATNLAVGLARDGMGSTVIVDLDVQFGDVASALNLTPEYALPDVLDGPGRRDPMALKGYLALHPTGLFAICGASSPAAADNVTDEAISDLIKTLAAEFAYVVVDTAPGMTSHTLAALDQSSDLVLVTSMDVPGVRGLRKELDTLANLGMFTEGRHLVLNFTDPSGGLTVGDVESAIGAKIDLVVPRSKAVPPSVNQGVPLLQSGGRDAAVRQLQQLVHRFVPEPAPSGRWRGRGRHRRAKAGGR